jgi:hypothetical protein
MTFGRRTFERKPQPLYAPVERRGTYANPDAVIPASKPEAQRNRHLLGMARGQACLLQIPLVCKDERETTVAAHSNQSIHGKGMSRKADDQYTVWACGACHRFLDQGNSSQRINEGFFMMAHLRQVDSWRGIVAGFLNGTPKDKAAAQWALDRLNATPVGSIE